MYHLMNALLPQGAPSSSGIKVDEHGTSLSDLSDEAMLAQVETQWRRHPLLVFALGPKLEHSGSIDYGGNQQIAWVVFWAIFVCLAALDLQLLAPKSGSKDAVSGKTASAHCALWFVVGLLFNAGIWYMFGTQAAEVWFNGYILEYLLSMDNVFFFHVVFTAYATPASQTYKALFLGILGAVVLRLIFYFVGEEFFKLAFAVQVFFGLVLVYSGFKTAATDEEEEDPREMCCVKLMYHNLPLTPTYDENGALFVRSVGEDDAKTVTGTSKDQLRLRGTMLFLVVLVLQVVDLIFAVDSVTAKIAEYDDIFINFSSSAFAMLCLRSMYFVLTRLLKYFRFLKYGVALILVGIGVKLIINPWFKVPEEVSLGTICGVFLFSIVVSAIFPAAEESESENPVADAH